MPFTVALVHAHLQSVDLINREFSLHLPHVRKFNILDEAIFFDTMQNGLTARSLKRLIEHFIWAEQMKANVIVNTTTILEPAVPICQESVSVPILRFSEPMCELALAEGNRICVLGSMDKAIESVAAVVQEVARRRGGEAQVTTRNVPDAQDHLDMGDVEMHDRAMVAAAQQLAGQCDAIVVAQIALLPLVPALKRAVDIPVFGSAETLIERLAQMASNRPPTPLPGRGTEATVA